MDAATAYVSQRHFVGTITPSGNTVVERVTIGVAQLLPSVSVHFSRTPVFGSADPSPGAYATEGLLAAADLLAHARPQVLLWNGSKGAGIGFSHDDALVAGITARTGIPATTSVIGLRAVLGAKGITRIGVVTPYDASGQRKTLECLAREGYACVADAHAGLHDNLSYAGVAPHDMMAMARSVAAARPQAIVSLCTNYPGAVVAAALEAELGLPVYDSTALGLWHALRLCGADTGAAATQWGSLFREPL